MKRILTLIATMLIQLCLGTLYIWSVYQTGISTMLFEGDNSSASLAYSISLAALSMGGIISGPLIKKLAVKYVVLIGGVIFSLGLFLSSLVTPEMPFLIWITYGVIAGAGCGFCYSLSISNVQKLFPDKKGLVTGMIVASLGLGGVVFTPLAREFITSFGGVGVGELETLRIMSFIMLGITVISSFFISSPETTTTVATVQGADITPAQALKKPLFYLLTLSMMFGCMGGLMIIGFATPIAEARGMAEFASVAVILISIFNALGRLTWGAVTDKIGCFKTLLILQIGTVIAAVAVGLDTGFFIFVFIGLVGFMYGGYLSIYPTLTAQIFGAKSASVIYSMVLGGFGIAAIIASYMGGYFRNIAADDINLMLPAFIICSVTAFISIFIVKFIQAKLKKEEVANP